MERISSLDRSTDRQRLKKGDSEVFDRRHDELEEFSHDRIRKIEAGFPDVEGIPDWVYEGTDIPQDMEDCSRLIGKLDFDIESIKAQLELQSSESDEWKRRAKNALTGKIYQKSLLAIWRKKERYRRKEAKSQEIQPDSPMGQLNSIYADLSPHASAAYQHLEALVKQSEEKHQKLAKKTSSELEKLRSEISQLYKVQDSLLRSLVEILAKSKHSRLAADRLVSVMATYRGNRKVDNGFLEKIQELKNLFDLEDDDRDE